MNAEFKFFEHKKCEYYPCHNLEEINCLFCYCPLMAIDCTQYGNPTYITTLGGIKIKDCSDCTFPHKRENYSKMMEILRDVTSTENPIRIDKVLKERYDETAE